MTSAAAALVTGAASGIGRAVAMQLATTGTSVALLDHNASGLAATREMLGAHAPSANIHSVALDLRDACAVRDAVAGAESALGPISAVASVAGVIRMGPVLPRDGGEALSKGDWDACMDTNARPLLALAQALLPGMCERKHGAWVTVTSNAASTPRIGMAAYAASKAAAHAFTMSVGLEVARHGVRCNTVSPGSTDTPMQRAFWQATGGNAEAVLRGDLAQHRLGIPLGRIASPADVARCVCFLLSDDARHVTLQDLCVDGGATP